MPEIGDTQQPSPRVVAHPVCGEEIEAWLKARGVKHLRCIEVPIENIDKKKSRHNQARPKPLVDETVEGTMLAYKRGVDLKPLIAYRDPPTSAQLILIDGNNRHEGATKAGKATLPVYIVASDTPIEKIFLLTVEANGGHGVKPSEEWRIFQALQLVAYGGENTIEDICNATGLTEAKLNLHKNVAKIDDRARPLKIAGWADLPVKTRHKLGQITSDRVFYNAAHMAITTKMNTPETAAVVRAVKAMHSEEEQALYIDGEAAKRKAQMAEEKAKEGEKKRIRAGVKQSLVSAIGKLLAVDEGALVRIAFLDTERQELMRRLVQAGDKITNLQIALETVIRGEEATG